MNRFFDGVLHTLPLLGLLLASFQAIPGLMPVEWSCWTAPDDSLMVSVWVLHLAGPFLAWLATRNRRRKGQVAICDLAPNLEGDTYLEGGHSGPSPDIQGRSADFEPSPDMRLAVELREVDRWEQTWG